MEVGAYGPLFTAPSLYQATDTASTPAYRSKLHNPTQCAFAHICDPGQCPTEGIDEVFVKNDEGQA